MPVSEAKKKANAKWDSENMATLACKMKKEQAEKFKKYCKIQGKTSNTVLREYVLSCIGEENGEAIEAAKNPFILDETTTQVINGEEYDIFYRKRTIPRLGPAAAEEDNKGGSENE